MLATRSVSAAVRIAGNRSQSTLLQQHPLTATRELYRLACFRRSYSTPKQTAGRGGHLTATALFGSATAGQSLYDISVKNIDGRDLDLSSYKGKVLLIVNVASACGFTPQYKELGELYTKYKNQGAYFQLTTPIAAQGLVIIGAPSNEFGGQEPGSNSEIKKFAKARGAEFPMLAKLKVNGSDANPLYKFLKQEKGGILTSDIKWNFTKKKKNLQFLVDRDGRVVNRYGSVTTPLQIEDDIKKLL